MDLLYRVKALWSALRGHHYTWPAIDISLPGDRHFHLIGSIHMGSREMAPLPAKLLKKLYRADALIVEADVSGDDAPFANLPTFAALEERISDEQLRHVQKVSAELGISPSLFSTQPLWQIAMILQATQAQQLGLRAEYGIDYQLLKQAKQAQKPVIELEGAASQIDLLCQLPDNGLALLDDTLTHWHTNARLLQQMMGWWLKTPPQNNDLTLPNTFSQSLYDVLMHQRNEAWRDKLNALPAGHYVVAVGALHLYGEGNLPEMLR
ncbi:TraB/GumN family protein [Citrobacter freundii]|uniref:TraB/GumN family protein n=1 Tax=Citrobacter freundii TaxID=546 RepID=UPI0015E55181|nr:TraB/GumN family protein [Citrobacter freundii]QLO43811.1 TraB/GumN family protein [Citrobacter freundii]QLV41973.1 TraB/GumN family protein [Citrobacter freundii]